MPVTNLVKKTPDFNTKITEIEGKIPHIKIKYLMLVV